VKVRPIRITDEPIAEWSDDLEFSDDEFGKICVGGPMVTKDYFGLLCANALSKIRDGAATWHRIGDVCYRDAAEDYHWRTRRKRHPPTPRTQGVESV
jgi:acyl-CoA synthetase (AMP-forming)/AMP-acid ligase II